MAIETGARPSSCHARACRQAVSRAQRPIGRMSPDSSATGMKRAGRHHAVPRAMPADERLDADDGAGLEVDLRLIVEDELVPRDRLAQVGLDGLALDGIGVHLGPEELIVIAPGVFRLIHGEVGVAQQGLGIRRIAGKGGDADARA